MKKLGVVLVIACFGANAWANSHLGVEQRVEFKSLVIPALIAAIGYILKTIYELLVERSKRKRSQLEDKLKDFYWPILTRLEQNAAIWKLILHKRDEKDQLKVAIAEYVEAHILIKNHREIMEIIRAQRYHAKFDEKLTVQLHKFFKHVAIYEGIIEANVNTLPGLVGAPYEKEFDEIFRKQTIYLQKKLDRKGIF